MDSVPVARNERLARNTEIHLIFPLVRRFRYNPLKDMDYISHEMYDGMDKIPAISFTLECCPAAATVTGELSAGNKRIVEKVFETEGRNVWRLDPAQIAANIDEDIELYISTPNSADNENVQVVDCFETNKKTNESIYAATIKPDIASYCHLETDTNLVSKLSERHF